MLLAIKTCQVRFALTLVEQVEDSSIVVEDGRVLDGNGIIADSDIGNEPHTVDELGIAPQSTACQQSHLLIPETVLTDVPSSPRPRPRSRS